MEYFGTTLGKLRIPSKMFIESPEHLGFGINGIKIEWDPKKFKIPKELEGLKNELVERGRKKAEENGALFYDGALVRLAGCSSKKEPILKLQPTSYFDFQATNASLDKRIEDKTIRELCTSELDYFEDDLANPLGVSVLLLSEPENRMVYSKRSGKAGSYRDLFQNFAAGFMDQADLYYEMPHPAVTAKRETEEETGFSFDLEDYRIMGVGRDSIDLHGDIIGKVKTNLKVNEILGTEGTDSYELSNFRDVEFTPENVIPFFRGYAKNDYVPVDWLPVAAVNALFCLMGEYGEERVKQVIDAL